MANIFVDESRTLLETTDLEQGLLESHLMVIDNGGQVKHVELTVYSRVIFNEPIPTWKEIFEAKLQIPLPPVVMLEVKRVLVEVFNRIYKGKAKFDTDTMTLVNNYPVGGMENTVMKHFLGILEYGINHSDIEVDEDAKKNNISIITIPVIYDVFIPSDLSEMTASSSFLENIFKRSTTGKNIILKDFYETTFMAKRMFDKIKEM